MRLFVLLPLSLLCLPVAAALAAPSAKPPPPFRVVGYLPEYRVATLDPAALSGVTDCVFFSLEPAPDGGLDTTRLTPAVAARLQALRRHALRRFWVTLGGWDRSAGFVPLAADAGKRRRFAGALTAFCLSHGFAGADFDWEHPADAGQAADYSALLVDTHAAFAPHGLRLSVTVAPWQTLNKTAIDAVDEVHLMSYDHPGRHSTLAQAQADTEAMLAIGVPASKLLLGIPFYGRGIADGNKTLAYADVVVQYHPKPSDDEADSLYFNGPDTVRAKVRYAVEKHLGGVMVWELGQDAPGAASLLKAMDAEVKGRR